MSMWGKPHEERSMEHAMLLARLKAYQTALQQILDLADGHCQDHDAISEEAALMQIGDLAETALKL